MPLNNIALPRCAVCQNDHRVSLIDKDLNLFKCSSCMHSFTIDDRDDAAIYSDEYYTKTHKNWFETPFYQLFKSLNDSLSAIYGGKRIKMLDVGFGNGDFLAYIRKANPLVSLYGIDLYDCRIDGVNFTKGDFLKEGFDEKFDVICSLSTIEHVKDPVLFIKKARESLLPGGLICITTINSDDLFYRIARALNKIGAKAAYERLYNRHHLQHYTNRSLHTLMEANGFHAISHRNHNYPARAVDVPSGGVAAKILYPVAVRAIFTLSHLFNGGILQTIICRKAG